MITLKTYQFLKYSSIFSMGSLVAGVILLMVIFFRGKDMPIKVGDRGFGNFFSIYNLSFALKIIKQDMFSLRTLSIVLIYLGSLSLIITFLLIVFLGLAGK